MQKKSCDHWLYSSLINPKFKICGACGAAFVKEQTTGWKCCPMCQTVMVDKGVITDEQSR